MIFSGINSFFPHDIMDKAEDKVFVVKDSVEIASPDAAVRRHVCVGSSVFKLNHRHRAAQVGGGAHVNLVAFQLTVFKAVQVLLLADAAVNSRPGLSALEDSGSVQQAEAAHVSTVFHMLRIVELFSENLETTADTDDAGIL